MGTRAAGISPGVRLAKGRRQISTVTTLLTRSAGSLPSNIKSRALAASSKPPRPRNFGARKRYWPRAVPLRLFGRGMSPTHFSTSSECELRYILRRNYAAAVDWNCHLEKDIRKRIGGGSSLARDMGTGRDGMVNMSDVYVCLLADSGIGQCVSIN